MTIITLIHGTWARGAHWAKDSSPLAIALKERIHDEVRIESLPWSGLNLHFMRLRAAAALEKHILSLEAQFPNARQFLVAHSHAGNVALYALANPEVMRSVNGTICLATPFIQCRPRLFPEHTPAMAWLLLMLLVFALSFRYGPDWAQESPGVLFIMVVAFTIGLGQGVRTLLSRLVLGRPSGSFAEIYSGVAQSFSFPPLSEDQLLILVAHGDEAKAALGASRFASWVFGRLSSFVGAFYFIGEALVGFGVRLGRPTRIFFACYFIFMFLYTASSGGVFPAFSFLMGVSLLHEKGFDAWALLLQLTYIIVLTPLLLLCSFFSAPFGIDAALVGGFLEFSADTTPTGRFSVLSLQAPTARGLWHSLPYSDSEAFEAIVQRIDASANSVNG